MSTLRLMAHQARFDVRSQLRSPPTVFFSLALPVIFLLIFAALFGQGTEKAGGAEVSMTAYLVPGIVTLGIVSTTYVNLAIGLTVLRQNGLLKRIRATPLPLPVFMFGRVVVQIGFAFMITIVLSLVGLVLFGVAIPLDELPDIAIVVAIGAACFASLGIAMSAAIPNEDSAPAITNVTVLPLYFISGVFFPVDEAPKWMTAIADIFPIKHLATALLAAFDPAGTGASVLWGQLAIVALWGVAGMLLALRFFRWSPK
ncbi:MAG: type transport system permease protein [Thermoleophilaceae bacterium]|jgi:ABC-2 type transport system permease protein|nr:type transport system permease protein [Thermoleophilaceae bacterium]